MTPDTLPDTLPASLGAAALAVLATADAAHKAETSRAMAAAWFAGDLDITFPAPPPERPARPDQPRLLPPREMPRRRAGGSPANRAALLHALAHIELNAIDLAWDMVARFGPLGWPRAFFDDWVGVADDEARHFGLLTKRLEGLGVAYGDLPAHDGLWDAACKTAHDPIARLAVVPLVLEARGLDVTPATAARLARLGDDESAAILELIYHDEIRHVAAGKRWLDHACRMKGIDSSIAYQEAVRTCFNGGLKPPFNEPARRLAGLSPDLYLPLVNSMR